MYMTSSPSVEDEISHDGTVMVVDIKKFSNTGVAVETLYVYTPVFAPAEAAK